MEEVGSKKRKIEYSEKTRVVKDEYKYLVTKENDLAEFKNRLTNHFRIHWKNLDISGVYNVSRFTVNNKGNFTYVGVLAEIEELEDVYIVKGYHKNVFTNAFNNKEKLKEDGYIVINNSGLVIISLPNRNLL